MLAFILRRLAQAVLVMLTVGLIAFSLFRFVGDPVMFMLGQDATPEQRAEITRMLGLDRPFYVQYLRFLGNALQGEFGLSLRQVQPVHIGRLADALRERLQDGELAEVLLSDLILTGRLPTPGGPQAIWIVLEVSTTVDRRDVERAQRRAALLRQARYPAVAVAGGMEATAGARQAASDTGVALRLNGRIDGWQEAVDHMLAEGEAGSP